jgi:hypothetical protein
MKRFATITFNDKKHDVKCTFDLIQQIERRPGLTITGMAQDLATGRPNLSDMAWIIYFALKFNDKLTIRDDDGKKKKLNFQEVGEMLSEADVMDTMANVNAILDACLGGDATVSDDISTTDDDGETDTAGKSEEAPPPKKKKSK